MPKTKYDETTYKNEQTQRYNERQIRSWKKRAATKEAAGIDASKENAKVREWQAVQRKHVEDNDLSRVYQRERVANQTANRAVARANKEKRLTDVFNEDVSKKAVSTQNETDYTEYFNHIEKRLNSGTPAGKQAFSKFITADNVVDAAVKGTSYEQKGKIYMNYLRDSTNSKGIGQIFLHEHGHLIDYLAKRASANPEFSAALKNDVKSYIMSVAAKNAGLAQNEIETLISKELVQTDKLHGISDLFRGITDGKITGQWGHMITDYKKPLMIEGEAFAHMFEAQFDAEKLAYFTKYFPSATKEFDNILWKLINQ